MRYKAENSGAVLDTKTGLREWFNSYAEAIGIASMKARKQMSDDLVEIVALAISGSGDPASVLDIHRSRARLAIEAIEAAGYVVVPREPTEKMWDGWRSVNCRKGGYCFEEFTHFSGDYGAWVSCYQAMLAALEKDKANVG